MTRMTPEREAQMREAWVGWEKDNPPAEVLRELDATRADLAAALARAEAAERERDALRADNVRLQSRTPTVAEVEREKGMP